MAQYSGGYDISDIVVLPHKEYLAGVFSSRLIKSNNAWLSTDQYSGGSYSFCTGIGGYKEVFYALDAGSATVEIYVYALPGSKPLFYIETLGGEKQDSDTTAVEETWTQLSLSFTAVKQVYRVVLSNPVPLLGGRDDDEGQAWCYWDNLS